MRKLLITFLFAGNIYAADYEFRSQGITRIIMGGARSNTFTRTRAQGAMIACSNGDLIGFRTVSTNRLKPELWSRASEDTTTDQDRATVRQTTLTHIALGDETVMPTGRVLRITGDAQRLIFSIGVEEQWWVDAPGEGRHVVFSDGTILRFTGDRRFRIQRLATGRAVYQFLDGALLNQPDVVVLTGPIKWALRCNAVVNL